MSTPCCNRWSLPYDPSGMETLRGRHAGQQAIILASGPSLKQINLELLRAHPGLIGIKGTYSLGLAFRYWIGLQNTFIHENIDKIAAVKADKLIFNWSERAHLMKLLLARIPAERLAWASQLTDHSNFFDMTLPRYRGTTVMFNLALPFAVYCGYKEIILLGADYPVTGYTRFYEQGKDGAPIHAAPETATMTSEMEMATARADAPRWANTCEAAGVEVWNCSPGSALPAFEQATLEAVLQTRPRMKSTKVAAAPVPASAAAPALPALPAPPAAPQGPKLTRKKPTARKP